ncbi:MAG TPA: ABC transporter permease [Acidobacteriaceae bacterium]|jgi:predicted permease|nr:ABC transporter permease [Acidobacteriaceae bacterium]
MMREFFTRLRFFFTGKSRATVDEELQFHLDRLIEANLTAGLSPAEARRRALLAFGGRERAREQCRQQRPSWSLELFFRDLRYGLRGLLHNPGFSTVAVLTLALAIGANTTIFSLLDQALLRALPVHDPGQLVVLSFAGGQDGHVHSDGGDSPGHAHEFSYPMFLDLRDKNQVFSGLIAAANHDVGVTWNNRAESVSAELVTGNYFQTLGIHPALGRLFVAADETAPGANPVAVLNFDYWRTHLAEAPVVDKTLLVNGTPFTIVGVAAPGFHSMVWGRLPDIYVPITEQSIVIPDWSMLDDHQSYWLNVVGRLRSGISPAQASASLNPLFHSLRAAEFTSLHDQSTQSRKDFITDAHLNLEDGAQGFSPTRQDLRTPLTVVMGMVLLVIAMAVVNVASLLLVRAATRAREFSVRYALGATGGQVMRQLLAEGLILGLTGAAIGLALAPEALRLLIHWTSAGAGDTPPFAPTLDWRVLAFSLGITLLASLLFSLAPAAQFWNPRLVESLKQQSNTGLGASLKFRRTCVALQIGFSLVLIVAAGLFVRTIQNLRHVNVGFTTDHLLAFNLAPELAGYPPDDVAPVEQRVLDAVAALPGIRSVGATNDPDLQEDGTGGSVVVSGYTPPPNQDLDVELPAVSTGYLQTLGIPLLAGRYFNAGDTATSQKVAVVNELFAKHYFGSVTAALGHHVSRPRLPLTDAMIVGVVANAKHNSVRDPAKVTFYIPFAQSVRRSGLTYYVRTWQPPDTAANGIRAAVTNIDARLIVSDVSTLTAQIEGDLFNERIVALLAAIFGILATVLAGIGLYGILAYSTAQRTREIGIRMALGARRGSVVGLIVREVLLLAGGTILVTLPLAVLFTRAVRSQLFNVSIVDPRVYGAAVLVIAGVAALAAFIPARRAATVDPARALRTD